MIMMAGNSEKTAKNATAHP